jgi:hypothetical protein
VSILILQSLSIVGGSIFFLPRIFSFVDKS